MHAHTIQVPTNLELKMWHETAVRQIQMTYKQIEWPQENWHKNSKRSKFENMPRNRL